MKKSRRIKRRTKSFFDKFNTTFTKAIAITIAVTLLAFSFLFTVANGQEPSSGDGMNDEFNDIMQKKNNLRKINTTNSDIVPTWKGNSVLENLLIPTAGDVDLSFNPSFATYVGSIRTSVLQPDGKLLIGGFFISINGITKYNLARFNIDGSLDATFSPKVSDGVYSIALQPDGKILIGGAFTFVNNVSRNRVARLNSDGSLDASFNPGGGTDNTVFRVALQSDGKILVGGFFTLFNGVANSSLARLNSNGSLDTSFSTNTNSTVYAIVPLADGKILIGGFFGTVNGTSQQNFARLNSNGSLDTTVTTLVVGSLREIILQPDGKILIGGNLTSVNSTSRNRIARLNTDFSLDTTFNPGTGFNSTVWTINLPASGKMLVGGQFTTFNGVSRNGITQLNADGSLDTTFNVGTGFNVGAAVYSIKILPSGQIGVGGFFMQYNGVNRDIGVVLNTDGSLDPSFSLSTLFQANIRVAVTQFDGKIIVGGTFNRINGQIRNNIARLNTDGTLDTSFNIGSGANAQVYTMDLQNDGKVLIGGSFTTYNGTTRNRIARLNSDGTLDSTFNPGIGADAFVAKISENGKIYVGGSFTTFNGQTAAPGLVRLNNDGSIDSTFTIPTGLGFVEGIYEDINNSKVIIGGIFTNVNGTLRNSIARLNTNGTLDTTFVPVTSANTGIYSLDLQADGKILIGGTFSSIGGINQKNIARLNSNGSLDTSFNVGTGTSEGDDVEDIIALRNGKVLISGLINSVNGTPRSNIARLNANGTLDNTFTAAADNIVWDIEVDETFYGRGRKIFIGGDFFAVNGVSRSGLAGLFIEPNFNRTRFDFDGDGKTDYGVFRPSDRVWYLQNSTTGFAAAQFGLSTDKIVPADYDGDGKTDIAVYRDGTWYLLRTTLGFGAVQFGVASDVPVPADTSDDGQADLIVFRPSEGNWYRLDLSNGAVTILHWGQNGDIPISASDYYASEDGVTVFRPSNGVWYILNEGDSPQYIQWGQNGDIPVASDYDGDGESDVAVYRNGVWYILQSSNGQARIEQFGLANDKPVVGDYDGDGKADLAVWRPSDRVFYVLRSNGNQFSSFQWGLSGDQPAAAAYLP